MKNENLKYGIGGLLIGGFAVWFITVTLVNSNNVGTMGMMGFKASTQQGMMQNSNTIDAHFIEQMIPHHQDAITMSNLALTKAQRPEVKQLAENIIDSQGREINQMRSWYKDWLGVDVPNNTTGGMMGANKIHMGMMGSDSDFDSLENASDFDKAFIEEMIPHHQMAVMMATMLKGGTQRSEMKKLANDIIAAQTSEINQMRGWLKEWSK